MHDMMWQYNRVYSIWTLHAKCAPLGQGGIEVESKFDALHVNKKIVLPYKISI